MLYKKTGFPEESEIVLCKVTSVQYNAVFVKLLEYDLPGMIHISEVSPGRIRNIRDYVKEGKIIVCKVLRINRERKQIDLSLRRVTDFQRRQKVNEIKQEQLAEKIAEFVARQRKLDVKELYSSIMQKISRDYDSLYSFFEDLIEDESLFEKYGLDKELKEPILEVVRQRIKPPLVSIGGYFVIKSFEPDGIEIIKDALNLAKKEGGDSFTITYSGAGKYNFSIIAKDYKEAESRFSHIKEVLQDFVKSKNSMFEAVRVKD